MDKVVAGANGEQRHDPIMASIHASQSSTLRTGG
jgi:hypothetical protein